MSNKEEKIEELVLIDEFSQYCFDQLKEKDPEFLQEIGFTSEKDIANLSKENVYYRNDKSSDISCKFCKSLDTIQRSVQIRSVDEGESLINYCNDCKKTF
jgi:DNA-directed RNA polymerase subunit M/transcription elongation factor TFIIS